MNNSTFTFAVIFAVAIIADFIMVQATGRHGESAPGRGGWSAEAPLARSLKLDESVPGRGGWSAEAPFQRTARRLRDDESAPSWGPYTGESPLIIRTDRRVDRSVHDSMEAPRNGGQPRWRSL